MAKSEHKIGFAAYCRARIRGLDPRFRENLFYIIFLFLTKEKIEIKRSIQTFCRQARKLDGLTRPQIEEIGMENLTRFNRKYSVFKNIRGTAMYFQDMKKTRWQFSGSLGLLQFSLPFHLRSLTLTPCFIKS